MPDDLYIIVEDLNKDYIHKRRKLPTKEANSIELSMREKAILAASVLGDASINNPTKGYVNSNVQMKHSLKQEAWLKWKTKQLDNVMGHRPFSAQREPITIKSPLTGLKVTRLDENGQPILYQKIHMTTRRLRCITELSREMNTNNKLDCKKPWLYKYMTDEGLMVWWLDDGGLTGKGNRSGRLSVQGFPLETIYDLQTLLKNKWGIQTEIRSQYIEGVKYPFLYLNEAMTKKLLLIIMPHIPIKEMLYKALPTYVDVTIQQDWISTMYKKMKPELHEDLTKLLRAKFSSKLFEFK